MEDHLKRLCQLVDACTVGNHWKTYVDAFVASLNLLQQQHFLGYGLGVSS